MIRNGNSYAGTNKIDHIHHGIVVSEAICLADDELYLVVCSFNSSIAQSVSDCIEDEFPVALYLSGNLSEGLNTGVGSPPSPLVKEETGLFRLMAFEYHPQLFLNVIGTVIALAVTLYLLKPVPLVLCKILRSLADGER